MTPLALRSRASAALAWLWRQAVPVVAPELPRPAIRAPVLVRAPAPPPAPAPAPPRPTVQRSGDPAELHRYLHAVLARGYGWLPACARDEIVQEALCLLFERECPIPLEEARPWLRATIRILALTWWNRCGRRDQPIEEEPPDEQADDPDRAIEMARLWRLIGQAPERHRQILVRVYLHGDRLSELAETEGPAVHTRRRAALAWLRRAIGEAPPEREPQAEIAARQADREAGILEYFGGAPGWVPARRVNTELVRLGVGHHLQVRHAVRTLVARGAIEARGTRSHTEYRLTGGAP